MHDERTTADILKSTTEIIVAFLSHRSVEAPQLPELVRAVRQALAEGDAEVERADARPEVLDGRGVVTEPAAAPGRQAPTPAFSRLSEQAIRDSVQDEYVTCFEDGKRYRSLRRHLMAKYNMTPDDYRSKWGLPADYPMVAPSYARERAAVARRIGLGKPETRSTRRAVRRTSSER